MQHSETHLFASDGTRLYVQAWLPDGEAKGTLSLVHGLGEHSGRYARLAEDLTASGYALVAMDLRGHGQSRGKRGHALGYETLLDDVETLLMYVYRTYPDRAVFLYGHSLGGGIVLNYALRRSPLVAGIVATSPWLRTAFELPEGKRRMAETLCRFVPSLCIGNGLELEALSHDSQVVSAYKADPDVHPRISLRLAMDAFSAGEWAIAHASSTSVPVLLMHGTGDRITSHEATVAFSEAVPSSLATIILWPGLYHELHNEPERERVIACLIEWLDERA